MDALLEVNKESGQYKACLKKKAYSSEIQAAAMSGIQQFHDKKPIRWYRCPWCREWHLTHTERR